ncbi:MAG: LysM peptidoglycan-binding domain-containing protein [Anaerolineales bacterium]|jgi:LysM repeat protein
MNDGKSTRSVIESYRKRRQQNRTFIVWGGAALLILIGIILLVVWLLGPSQPLSGLFATETPTPTLTFTPTLTNTPTETPTVTATFTETLTPTQSAPYTYIVQEGDFLATISENENLGPDGVALILLLNPYTEEGIDGSIDPTTQIVYPGQEILLPNPGMPLPTATPIPADLPRGTILTYAIQAGDTLAGIAIRFNSTIDDIIEENDLEDPNAIFVGQQLDIPVNMVTATATFPPTSTPLTPEASTSVPTATP